MTSLTVNNQPVRYRLPPDTPLLWALRDASNLTGTKYGCDTGQCGACTVDVDGRALRSCRVPVGALEGTYVTTIEGLSRERSHPVQLAFLAGNVVQCGFCIPGFIMAGRRAPAARPGPERSDDPGECHQPVPLRHLPACGGGGAARRTRDPRRGDHPSRCTSRHRPDRCRADRSRARSAERVILSQR